MQASGRHDNYPADSLIGAPPKFQAVAQRLIDE
jgi:hypothetical protein